MAATLASVDSQVLRRYPRSNFFSRRRTDQVLAEMRDSNAIIVSEPFSYKHHVRTGDSITLSLGATQATSRIAYVYYDYSTERGTTVMPPSTILASLPSPTPSTLPLYP